MPKEFATLFLPVVPGVRCYYSTRVDQ